MEGSKKAALVAVAFVLFYLAFGWFNFSSYGTVNNGQDFEFHWGRVQGIDFEKVYPWGYHNLFSVFSFNQFAFYAVNVLVVAGIGLLLFVVSGKWWTAAIYFGGMSLPHQLLYGATYPQAFVLLLFALYLVFRRNLPLLVCIGIVSSFFHDKAFFLFGPVFVLELASLVFPKVKKRFLPAVGFLQPSQMVGLDGAIAVFLLQLPLPVFFFGLRGLKSGFFALVAAGSFFAAMHDFRALSVFQMVFAVCAGIGVSKCSKKVRAGFALFLVFQAVFYLLDFGGGTWKFITLN